MSERIHEVNRVDGTVWCQGDVALSDLEAHVNANGFTLGQLSPGARALDLRAFLEGAYEGLRPVPNGRLEPISLSLAVEFRNGAPWSSPHSPRRAAGPELEALFLGARGRYGSVRAATVRLQPKPTQSITFATSFADVVALQRTVTAVLQAGARVGVARVGAERSRVCLELELQGDRESIERDLSSFRRIAEALGGVVGGTNLVSMSPRTDERVLTWTQVSEAVRAGCALRMFRLSVDGVIAQGAREHGHSLRGLPEAGWENEGIWRRIAEEQP